jgi:hypothetical protein
VDTELLVLNGIRGVRLVQLGEAGVLVVYLTTKPQDGLNGSSELKEPISSIKKVAGIN